jgi:putative transposase
MSPDELWAAKVGAGVVPRLVEPELRDDLFRPYEVRRVQRGMVAWNTNRYVHPALGAHEGEDVLVGYDDADARHVWIRLRDRRTGEPGPLLCVAEFAGGQDFLPRTRIEAARQAREKAALTRIRAREQAVLDERRPAALIEHRLPLPSALPVAAMEPVAVPPPANDAAPWALPEHSDAGLAAWALEGGALSEGQLGYLRDCASRPGARAHLAAEGIDLEALEALLRARPPTIDRSSA